MSKRKSVSVSVGDECVLLHHGQQYAAEVLSENEDGSFNLMALANNNGQPFHVNSVGPMPDKFDLATASNAPPYYASEALSEAAPVVEPAAVPPAAPEAKPTTSKA